ncbi:MAG TPA: 50S ribosomal protein L20 [Chthonomonadales bacterium]|nr:50S ribosomal protein L20 [Chthonomonadales bacterium]
MPRVKRGTLVRKRHKKIIEAASGYFGGKKNLFRTAHEQFRRSGNFAYRDRRNKKRDFRRLWITRISAACRLNGTSYNRFIEGLNKAGIAIDRKVLSDIAITDPGAFTQLVARAASVLGQAG